MKHRRLLIPLALAALVLTIVAAVELYARSSVAAPVGATAEQKFKNWTASKGMVRVYSKPSTHSTFMHDELYADEQTIKVMEIVPGHNKLSWLKVQTPSNQIGYVFSGEARPANISRSGKLVQSPTMDD